MKKVLGFDVGGTKIEAAVFVFSEDTAGGGAHPGVAANGIGAPGEILECALGETDRSAIVRARVRRPTERSKGYEHVVAQMAAAAGEALQQSGLSPQDLDAVGVGLPGAVDPDAQVMTNGNTLVLIGKPLGKDLAAKLHLDQLGSSAPSGHTAGPVVRMGNDANCFALAEHYCGAGLKVAASLEKSVTHLTSVGLILGTGCGGGLVINGLLHEGAQGGAAELGHTVLYPQGHSCYCGQNGCAEQYLSGTAIEAHFAARRYSQVQDCVQAREIFTQAAAGEPLSVAVIKQYRKDLAFFLSKWVNALNPHFFVLGGGVSLQPMVYDGLAELAARHSFLPGLVPVIYQNALGDSAGVVGAALLPLLRWNDTLK
jgi:fructokinase